MATATLTKGVNSLTVDLKGGFHAKEGDMTSPEVKFNVVKGRRSSSCIK